MKKYLDLEDAKYLQDQISYLTEWLECLQDYTKCKVSNLVKVLIISLVLQAVQVALIAYLLVGA